ncbi:MAG: hypothetical protein JRN42_05845 [Nitrososphaerota archaeon]|nr:hypothetical protein [Nitrososphaerota archaeon]
MSYVYKSFEPGLWTVGFYSPDGEWHPESDWQSREEAANRVHYLERRSLIVARVYVDGEEVAGWRRCWANSEDSPVEIPAPLSSWTAIASCGVELRDGTVIEGKNVSITLNKKEEQ